MSDHLPESFSLASALAEQGVRHQKGLSQNDLAKDNPETNPITIKPKTTELFFWIPLLYCSPPGFRFPFPLYLLLCQHMCLLGQFISESLTRAQFQALEGVPLPATVSH